MKSIPLIVPDVNVLVSGTAVSNHPPALIVEAWKDEIIEFATSEPILADLRRVFTYPHVLKLTRMNAQEVTTYIQAIREGSHLVPGTMPVEISPDPADNKLFACAIEAGADYVVSGDKKDVLSVGSYEGVETISPGDFVRDVLMGEKAA